MGDCRGLGTGVDPELGQDPGHVHAGGLRRDEQLLADLVVRQPLRHQAENLDLAARESGDLARLGRPFGRNPTVETQPASTGQLDDAVAERLRAEIGGDAKCLGERTGGGVTLADGEMRSGQPG